MAALHSFKINAAIEPGKSTVEIDGRPLDGVRRVSFDIVGGEFTVIKLEIYGAVVVDGVFRDVAILNVEDIGTPRSGME